MEPFDVVDLIIAKRDGRTLTVDEINWLVDAYTREFVQDEQMAALAMAIFFQGMQQLEIQALTNAMVASGERLNFASLQKPTVDKHSTGGVGDKITLPLVPLVASFGVAVPQLSGRGLGHTGGTLDKMEAIPGWRANLTNAEMLTQLDQVGGVICAAGSGLALADKKLYALRDITGTVESIPLIASSIMSKKIAEGTDALVLDVKFGRGAFMKDADHARELAETLVALGTGAGVKTSALLTDMNEPLGNAIGNAIEVEESVAVLQGEGPQDIIDLTVALAEEMLTLAGVPDADVRGALQNGQAYNTWREMLIAQGGDPDAALPKPREVHEIVAETDGVLDSLDAYQFGLSAWRLGAGRARQSDPVQHAAGICLHKKRGDQVKAGDVLFTLGADEPERFERALEALENAWRIETDGHAAKEIVESATRHQIVRETIRGE